MVEHKSPSVAKVHHELMLQLICMHNGDVKKTAPLAMATVAGTSIYSFIFFFDFR